MKKHKLLFVAALALMLVIALVLVACNDKDSVHKVTFSGEGVEEYSVEVENGKSVAEPTAPVRNGFQFLGWFQRIGENELSETAYDFSAKVTGDITLVAKWAENGEYVITLNPGLGSADKATVTVKQGESYNLGVATYAGNVFVGWMYNHEYITDRNGASLKAFSYGMDITVIADFEPDSENVDALAAAIDGTGDNYTANFFSGNTKIYEYRCMERGFMQDFNKTDQLPQGFMILPDDLAHALVYSKDENGAITGTASEQVYTVGEKQWTAEDVKNTYFVNHILKAEQFNNVSTSSVLRFEMKSGYVNSAKQLLYTNNDSLKDLVNKIFVEVRNGRLSKITLNSNDTPVISINLAAFGTTSIDLDYLPFVSQMPNTTDPTKEYAPATYGFKNGEGVKAVDSYVNSDFVNGEHDADLAKLAQAIQNARGGISYVYGEALDWYYSGTGNNDSQRFTDEWKYRQQFGQDYRAYIAQLDSSGRTVRKDQYVVRSDNKTYLIYHWADGTYLYKQMSDTYTDGTPRDTWKDYTLGGNIFNKINASMFEATDNASDFNLKAEYYDTFFDLMFYNAHTLESVYGTTVYEELAPDMTPLSAKITINPSTGNIIRLTAVGKYYWDDENGEDTHTITITPDYSAKTLTMPYEWSDSRYNAKQIELKNARDRANYYTLKYDELGTVPYIEYWGKDVVYQEYWQYNDGSWGPYNWASSGWVFINDYAYLFELTSDGRLNFCFDFGLPSSERYSRVPGEPYDWAGQVWYRAYMQTAIFPLAQIDPLDFEWVTDIGAYKCVNNLSTYVDSEVFGWFEDESYATDMYIFLSDSGDIESLYFGTITKNTSGDLVKNEQYTIRVENIGQEEQYKL